MKIQIIQIYSRLLIAATVLFSSVTASADIMYVSNPDTNTIQQFTPAGVGSVFASGFNYPTGLAFDSTGNLFVANAPANTINKITPGGAVSLFANSGLDLPVGLAFDSYGNLYVSNTHSNQFSPGYIENSHLAVSAHYLPMSAPTHRLWFLTMRAISLCQTVTTTRSTRLRRAVLSRSLLTSMGA